MGQAQLAADAFNTAQEKAFAMAPEPPTDEDDMWNRHMVTSFGDIVGSNLKAVRGESGWTQEKLAEAMTNAGFDWKRVTCAEVEADTRRISMEELLTVAALFAVPAIELMLPKDVELELPYAGLRTSQVQELMLGRGGRVGEGGTGWPVARKALGSPTRKVYGPAIDLWRARAKHAKSNLK